MAPTSHCFSDSNGQQSRAPRQVRHEAWEITRPLGETAARWKRSSWIPKRAWTFHDHADAVSLPHPLPDQTHNARRGFATRTPRRAPPARQGANRVPPGTRYRAAYVGGAHGDTARGARVRRGSPRFRPNTSEQLPAPILEAPPAPGRRACSTNAPPGRTWAPRDGDTASRTDLRGRVPRTHPRVGDEPARVDRPWGVVGGEIREHKQYGDRVHPDGVAALVCSRRVATVGRTGRPSRSRPWSERPF